LLLCSFEFLVFKLQLELISSETDRPQIENGEDVQNTSITLRGFQPDKTYRFYCVRNSDGRIYSQSRSINCTKSLLLIQTNKYFEIN